MADDIMQELQGQLEAQEEALAEIEEALKLGEDEDLLGMKKDLQEAIEQLTASLLELKKEPLLASLEQHAGLESVPALATGDQMQQGPLVDTHGRPESATEDAAGAPEAPAPWRTPGSLVRFRYTDGQWYCGLVLSIGGGRVRLSFSTPTRDFMLREGAHVPLASLKPWRRTGPPLSSLPSGTRILACPREGGLWEEAELDAAEGELVSLVLRGSGQRLTLPFDSVALPDEAAPTDSEDGDDTSSSDGPEDDFSGAWEVSSGAGGQTETVRFAGWEAYTRGIGSKLMASMGYVAGSGLGSQGRGMTAPVEVRLLGPRAGLGADEGFWCWALRGELKRKRHAVAKERERRSLHRRRGRRERRHEMQRSGMHFLKHRVCLASSIDIWGMLRKQLRWCATKLETPRPPGMPRATG
eukprot:jgi/Botrbrau1/9298/Bobra.0111s0023.1